MIGINAERLPCQQVDRHRAARESVQHNHVVAFVLGQLLHAQAGIAQQDVLLRRFARRQVVKPLLCKANGSRVYFVKIIRIAGTGEIGQSPGTQTNERHRQTGFLRHGPDQGFANATVAGVIGGGHMAQRF